MSGRGIGAIEQRREVRVNQHIPLTITWVDDAGRSREELTGTDAVNSFGCRLTLSGAVEENMLVVCSNTATGKTRKAAIIWIKDFGNDQRRMVGLELIDPGADFWGEEAQVALQEAGLVKAVDEKKTEEAPPEIKVRRIELSRRGLLYSLLSAVIYYFLGGYSGFSPDLEMSKTVVLGLLPFLFFGGLGLAIFATTFYLRN